MTVYFTALAAILLVAGLAWVASVIVGKVSFVDSLWSLFFLLAAVVFAVSVDELSARTILVLFLVAAWSLRLSLHITVRNWGAPEDHRYEAIRANNEPGFVVKSVYIVFGLQGILAWLVAAPLAPTMFSTSGPGVIDAAALVLFLVGFAFEAVGDWQLTRFRSNPDNKDRVLNTGLWQFTRHPNYFGEFCVWWAFWLFALAAGAWWTIFSPLLMSFLLLRVSGVTMLERTVVERRPAYAEYIRNTNAFFPGFSKRAHAGELDLS